MCIRDSILYAYYSNNNSIASGLFTMISVGIMRGVYPAVPVSYTHLSIRVVRGGNLLAFRRCDTEYTALLMHLVKRSAAFS